MPKLSWKRQKTFAMLSNKRQWERDFDPTETSATEIELEQGGEHSNETKAPSKIST